MSDQNLQRDLDSQKAFLATIRQALGRETPGNADATRSPEDFSRHASTARNRSPQERKALITAMQKNAAPAKLMVEEVDSLSRVADRVVELVRDRSPEWGTDSGVVAWNTETVLGTGLVQACEAAGIPLTQSGTQDFRERCADALVGVTDLTLCVAETGTMVLCAGQDQARSTSLLPSIHVAIAFEHQIVADFPELYATLGAMEAEQGLPVQYVFVSGPSKTADIEATLVHGAHGPREAFLLVVTK